MSAAFSLRLTICIVVGLFRCVHEALVQNRNQENRSTNLSANPLKTLDKISTVTKDESGMQNPNQENSCPNR
jgi:hypothetical protein